MVNITTTKRQYYDTSTDGSVLSNIGNVAENLIPAAQKHYDIIAEQQKVKIDTNATKARVEANKKINEWRLQNQSNPDNQERKEELKNSLKEIFDFYGQDIDPVFKQNWDITVSTIMSAYEDSQNDWTFKQREQNAKLDVAENINTNYSLAFTHGMDGNIEAAIADLSNSYNQINGYAGTRLGQKNAKVLLKEYKQQFIKNFIDGQMQTNPSDAILSLQNEKIQKLFEDDPRKLQDMKDYATARFETMKRNRSYKSLVDAAILGGELINQSMEKNLSLEEIENLMPQNATEDYKNLIYSMNGYKMSNSKASKTTLSDEQKAIGQAEVYEQMAAVMADKNATPEDYSKLQDLIYKRMNDKSFSVTQGQKIINEIAGPMQEAWGRTLKKLSADEVGLFTGDVGAKGVLQTLEKNGVITEKNDKIKDKTLKEQSKAARARIINKAYELYYQELQNIVDQTPEYSTIADIAAEKDISKKRDILRSCQNKVTQSILEDKFSFLSTIDGDKKPNKVLSGGSLNLYTSNTDNAKLGTPVKETVIEKVGQSSGKFYALLSDGTTREISQKTYEQFLGQ